MEHELHMNFPGQAEGLSGQQPPATWWLYLSCFSYIYLYFLGFFMLFLSQLYVSELLCIAVQWEIRHLAAVWLCSIPAKPSPMESPCPNLPIPHLCSHRVGQVPAQFTGNQLAPFETGRTTNLRAFLLVFFKTAFEAFLRTLSEGNILISLNFQSPHKT